MMPAGRITARVGPNACGKSTALQALTRLLKPAAGAVHLDGRDIAPLPPRELALQLALLPLTPTAPDGITVRDLVTPGRTPHQRWWRQWSSADEAVIDRALEATGVAELARRGRYPCTVLCLGNAYQVVTADLLQLLHIDVPERTGIEEPADATPEAETPTSRRAWSLSFRRSVKRPGVFREGGFCSDSTPRPRSSWTSCTHPPTFRLQ